VGTTGHNLAIVLGLASTVSDLVGKLEHDLGVDGTDLTLLFCLVVGAIVVLLLIGNRASKKKALRLVHAGSFEAPDPYARSFHLKRSVAIKAPNPVTDGPARDPSNPRYRPETQLPDVPDPIFPTLDQSRHLALTDKEAAWTAEVPWELASAGVASTGVSSPVGIVPVPVSSVPSGDIPSGVVPSGSGGVAVATTAVSTAPLVGWYEDPDGTPGSLRFWDGQFWTERRPA
jgi:hypothetical protein